MLKNLFDLSYKRTVLQAIGWFVVYGILLLAITFLVLGIISEVLYIFKIDIITGHAITKYIMLLFKMSIIALLCIHTYFKKSLYHNIPALILMFFAMLTTFTLGGHLSLIFVAILTTFENKNNSSYN